MKRIALFACAVFAHLLPGPIWAGTLAQFRTPLGDIEVELFDRDKPVTVSNFIRYVQSGAYRDMFFHRYVPGFVMQGGGFFTTNRTSTQPKLAALPSFGNITNEFNVGPRISNSYGTIAMAKLGGDPDSASSQWFFNLTDNSANLDNQNGGFTVFGQVARGTNIFSQFTNLYRVNIGAPLDELPVRTSNPTVEDLVYVDISLLSVQVRGTPGGGREISWNSVTNRPNHVEFTVQMPPAWQTLISTNGTGAGLKVIDASTDAAQRFYRVRVDY